MLRLRLVAVGVAAALSILAAPGLAWAGGPGVWTKLATVDNGADTAGMLRTADGSLHLVWLAKRASNSTQSFGTSTISVSGKLLATGQALSNWGTLEYDPQLLSDGSGMRLVFVGNTGSSGCYADASVYTETSSNGSTWTLVHGSMDSHTVGTGNLAAADELNGTPVAAFASGHYFHIGVDPSCPASALDGTVMPTLGSAQSNPAIATDQGNGSVWVGWFQSFVKQGYWVEQILPTQGGPIEAPGSGSTALENNQPNDPVALTARPGGGVYTAYCAATSSQQCAHIDLWKVGSSQVKIVPGSHNSTRTRVALAAGPQGRLSVVWYDSTKNVIHAVRTNPAATAFGALRTIKPPSNTFTFFSIQAQGSSGRLDVILLDQLGSSGLPINLYHTQILAGLSLSAKPSKFSHKKAKKVTFTVTDAGQPVAGAGVSCLGKKGSTNTSGKVRLAFGKGESKGKHVCTASKSGYNAGKTTVKVT